MIGIIGGTGLYRLDGLVDTRTEEVRTPFGDPSSKLTIGRLGRNEVAFLPRHGPGHGFLPSEVNFRANIWALKSIGARQILSVSAVGSLREELAPGQLALPSQYVDFTRGKRVASFFGEGIVAHVSTAKPTCASLAKKVSDAAASLSLVMHSDKTYVCVEGPRFGTRAESFMFRSLGFDMVGMTGVPEVFLAREAQICYCPIAVLTDYDCWHEETSAHVTAEGVLVLYKKTLGSVIDLIQKILEQELGAEDCSCRRALSGAVMSDTRMLTGSKKELLSVLQR